MTVAAINTCALYGGSSYVSSWLPINITVVLICLLLVGLVYILSKVANERTRQVLAGAARAQLVEIFLGVIILIVLLTLSGAACSASASFSQQLTGVSQTPFAYAQYYTSCLAFTTGLGIYSSIFSTAISYQAAALDIQLVGDAELKLTGLNNIAFCSGLTGGIITCSFTLKTTGDIFTILSNMYLGVLAPLVMSSVGTLFIQFIMLPIFQLTAFTVLLPAALFTRMLPFSGGGLKNISNVLLALAIAFYIVYPMTVVMDSWIVKWMFSPATNPLYPYISTIAGANTVPASSFLTQSPTFSTSLWGFSQPSVSSIVKTMFFDNPSNLVPILNVLAAGRQLQVMIGTVVTYVFKAMALFALDLAITIGFAGGLAKALNAGFEGPAQVWSNL